MYKRPKPNKNTQMMTNTEPSIANAETKKPMCGRVAAMTTVAHNKSKQHFLNAKVNFSLAPDAPYYL
jgi:hypothetical protein